MDVWNLGSRGLEIVTDLIDKGAHLIVEVGSFMGGSTKRWLDHHPGITVIAIDPWEGHWWVDYAVARNRTILAQRFAESPYNAFLSAMWEYRCRIVPVKGASPAKLYEIHELGIRPDIIYFDSDKKGYDFPVAAKLFPNATICGDDWSWGILEGYPARRAARRLASALGKKVRVKRDTWVICDTTGPLDLLNFVESRARDLARTVKYAFK